MRWSRSFSPVRMGTLTVNSPLFSMMPYVKRLLRTYATKSSLPHSMPSVPQPMVMGLARPSALAVSSTPLGSSRRMVGAYSATSIFSRMMASGST